MNEIWGADLYIQGFWRAKAPPCGKAGLGGAFEGVQQGRQHELARILPADVLDQGAEDEGAGVEGQAAAKHRHDLGRGECLGDEQQARLRDQPGQQQEDDQTAQQNAPSHRGLHPGSQGQPGEQARIAAGQPEEGEAV